MKPETNEQRNSIVIHRNIFDLLGALILAVAVVAVLLVLGMQYWYADRIYPGVTVDGVSVGGLTRAAAILQLQETLEKQPLPPIAVSYGDQVWPVAVGDTAASVDTFDAVHQAYMTGRRGSLIQRFTAQIETLRNGSDIPALVQTDSSELRYAISRIASDVRIPARAGIVIDEIELPAQPGLDVDIDATMNQLVAALESESAASGPVKVPLVTIALPPPAEPESVSISENTDAEGRITTPLILRDSRFGYELAIDPATMNALIFSRQPLRLDEERVRAILAQWTDRIDIAPLDARLSFDSETSTVEVIQESQIGRELDIDSTLDSVVQAVADGSMEGELVIRDRLPAVDSRYVDQMGIRELVASGTTYFAGSSLARIHNIEVAAEKFDGVVVPPNGTFSFNDNVEDVTAANGFEDSLIIWGDQTAVGVGGGVCQVSTTVFRAAYGAGLPITERYNHGYVVGWYGDPGQDATIYTPSVDFKFRNDTGAYLLLEPVVDSINGVITFNLYGTKPDRTVSISEPVISDIIEPGPPVYRYDESLGYGEKEQVDWQQEGLTAKVTRTIVENGETRTETMTSKYEPWRAVYLYGPGAVVPATPTPLPRTDEITSSVDSAVEGTTDGNSNSPADSALPAALPTSTVATGE